MWDVSPTLLRHDALERASTETALLGIKSLASKASASTTASGAFQLPIKNFYMTDVVSRSSVTVSRSLLLFSFFVS